MMHLLGIEWLKVKRYRTFWVLAGLFFLLVPFWNFEIEQGFIKMGPSGKNGVNFLSTAYSFPEVWGNIGFWGSIFIVFISVLIIILTTNEYMFRTNRQNVIDGWTKMQFFHAKVVQVFLFSLVATVYLFILGVIFGGISSGSLSGLFSQFQQVGYFFLLSLDYLGFALFIAIWIRRSGLGIGLFFLYALIIENLVKGLVNHYADKPWGNLLFLQSSDELLPFPIIRMIKSAIPGMTEFPMSVYVLVTIGWCLVYYFASRAILLKRDW